MSKIKERLIVALDVDTLQEVETLVKMLGPHVGMFKVGLQLYTSLGPQVLKTIHELGGKIFADLKLHDIPNTVAQASRVLTSFGVQMLNVHASGGLKMMTAAAQAVEEEAAKKGIKKPLLIAVTVLTSLGQEDLAEVGLPESPENTVVRWAKLAQQAGLDGVVASPQETSLIQSACGAEFLTITPGVRPLGAEAGDQKRITTPKEAIKAGSSYLVIGRPITKSKNPIETVKAILAEMEEGLC
ncbi:orotidine-5'-phosphate decarboxylase [Bacillota bacterium LX-D]|nr:orotidine-5'-phosphate decarboxylase [Bacillota bacterium LX-D]